MGLCIQFLKLSIGMNKYHFNPVLIVVVAIVTWLLSGCGPLNQKKVAGYYVRSCLGVTDSISLDSNGTFEQKVIGTNGKVWTISGSWKIINQIIQLDKCFLSYDDEKQAVIIPPEIVYSCTFSLKGARLIRTELQPPWVKQTPPTNAIHATSPQFDPERDLGFRLPVGTQISLLKREQGLNTEVTYLKISMDSKSWNSLISKPPFKGMPTSPTSNPFLTVKKSFPGWNPQNVKNGIGGIINVAPGKTIVYIFTPPQSNMVDGYLMIGEQ